MDSPLASGPVLKMGVRIPLGALLHYCIIHFESTNVIDYLLFDKNFLFVKLITFYNGIVLPANLKNLMPAKQVYKG
jgi:hypothetical protein